MKDSNVFFLGTQTGVRVYTGHDDQWKDAGRHISGAWVGAPWAGWKPKSNSGYSDELKRVAVKAAVWGQLWGHHAIFEVRISRVDKYLQ
jgi:hypothetical protein